MINLRFYNNKFDKLIMKITILKNLVCSQTALTQVTLSLNVSFKWSVCFEDSWKNLDLDKL